MRNYKENNLHVLNVWTCVLHGSTTKTTFTGTFGTCRTANQKIEIKVGYMYKTFSNKEKNLYVGVVQCEFVLRINGRTGGGVRFGL